MAGIPGKADGEAQGGDRDSRRTGAQRVHAPDHITPPLIDYAPRTVLGRIIEKATFANVVSLVALFIALGGVSVAAVALKKNSVHSKQIAPNAAKGIDIKESSLGKVPKAKNADKVGGVGLDNLQIGNGYDLATGHEQVPDGTTKTIETLGGSVDLTCHAASTVKWNDAGSGGSPTDTWLNGAYEQVADGGSSTSAALTDPSTNTLQVWTNDNEIDTMTFSVKRNVNNTCQYVYSTTELFRLNLEPAKAKRLAAKRSDRR